MEPLRSPRSHALNSPVLRRKYFPEVIPAPATVELQTPSLISMCTGAGFAILLVLRTKWAKFRDEREDEPVSLGMVSEFASDLVPFFTMVRLLVSALFDDR